LALLRVLGTGLVAGASDNDPTTVASLAVIGSTTGFGLAWLAVLVIPMLAVVQVISAAVGTVCKAGAAVLQLDRRRAGHAGDAGADDAGCA
jgi:Mn2+/Fe2+ NRAMP family transporter